MRRLDNEKMRNEKMKKRIKWVWKDKQKSNEKVKNMWTFVNSSIRKCTKYQNVKMRWLKNEIKGNEKIRKCEIGKVCKYNNERMKMEMKKNDKLRRREHKKM